MITAGLITCVLWAAMSFFRMGVQEVKQASASSFVDQYEREISQLVFSYANQFWISTPTQTSPYLCNSAGNQTNFTTWLTFTSGAGLNVQPLTSPDQINIPQVSAAAGEASTAALRCLNNPPAFYDLSSTSVLHFCLVIGVNNTQAQSRQLSSDLLDGMFGEFGFYMQDGGAAFPATCQGLGSLLQPPTNAIYGTLIYKLFWSFSTEGGNLTYAQKAGVLTKSISN
jgi:hypothetical protein